MVVKKARKKTGMRPDRRKRAVPDLSAKKARAVRGGDRTSASWGGSIGRNLVEW